MSDSTIALAPDTSFGKVILCALLSLILHAGLLTGLQMHQKTEPQEKTTPLVQITLVPTQIPAGSPTSKEKTSEPITPPPMRTTSRSATSTPISTPPPPIVSQTQPIMTTSAVKLTPTSSTPEHLPQRPRKKSVKRYQGCRCLICSTHHQNGETQDSH